MTRVQRLRQIGIGCFFIRSATRHGREKQTRTKDEAEWAEGRHRSPFAMNKAPQVLVSQDPSEKTLVTPFQNRIKPPP